MAYEKGEIFLGVRVQVVQASANITKGDVVTITPASTPTAAQCIETGAAGPFGVAIEDITSGKTGRIATKGEVSIMTGFFLNRM